MFFFKAGKVRKKIVPALFYDSFFNLLVLNLSFSYHLFIMKNKLLFLTAFIFASFSAFSADFSDYEKNIIEEIQEFRFSTRKIKSAEQAVSAIADFRKSFLTDDVRSRLGKEAEITADNFLVLEQYNYMYEKEPESPELEVFIKAQYEKIDEWNQANPQEKANPYYLLSSGDLINSTMQFLPQGKAISLGLQEKKNYDMVVAKYPKLALGLINAALWYYFAPAIGGGSMTKAREYFSRAVECAANNYEKFYAYVYYSQFLYENDDKEGCEKYLLMAESLVPDGRWTNLIRRMNKLSYSVLDYSNNRKKIDRKLEEK